MSRSPLNILSGKTAAVCIAAVFAFSALAGCKSVSEDAVINDIHTAAPLFTEKTSPPMDEPSAAAEETAGTESAKTEETPPAETELTIQAESPEETSAGTSEKETSAAAPETTERPAETTESATEETKTHDAPVVVTVPPAPETSAPETETSAPETSAPETSASAANTAYAGVNSYNTLNFNEQKGIWISYLEYDSILKNKSRASFRNSVGKYFDNIKDLGFNTVYVQVRSFGDAYYRSSLFPSGDRFDGTMGTSKYFDALEIMISEAHDRGLSIHAWINPMRLMTDSQITELDSGYTVKQWYSDPEKNGKYIVSSGGRWYLNPAYSEVIDLIAGGITEIVSSYNVDGVQIDDYFYPTTAASFDSAAYEASGKSLSLSQWRMNNVNTMVEKLCRAVHNANPTALFGISPQGSISNNYNELYADVRTWCKNKHYCDYILPQVYFGFENAGLPYPDTISEWSEMCSYGDVKLVIGLAGYKIGVVDTYAGAEGKNEWTKNSDILSRQMKQAAKLSNYGGVAIFRYGSLFMSDPLVAGQVAKEVANIKKNSWY